MTHAHRYIASLFLSATLVVPASTMAAPKSPQDAGVQVRIYDEDHKDYHNWDDRENRAWERYEAERHIKAHEFAKAEKKEQADYWKWRHDHPDADDRDRDK